MSQWKKQDKEVSLKQPLKIQYYQILGGQQYYSTSSIVSFQDRLSRRQKVYGILKFVIFIS